MIMKEILSEDYIDDSELVINKDNKVKEKYTELIKEQNDFLNALVEKEFLKCSMLQIKLTN